VTRRGRNRPANQHPAVRIDIAAVVAEMPHVRRALRRMSVWPSDVADLEQGVLVGAWEAIEAGRFRPPPSMPVAKALRRWLVGIASNKVSHLRDRAHRRRERLDGLLPKVDVIAYEWDEDDRLDALADVTGLASVREPFRTVITLRVQGHELRVVARAMSTPLGTVANRERLGRAQLRRILRARGRR